MDRQYLNPKALGAAPRFYSHAVSIEGPARLVYVAGQISMDAEGNVVGAGDMRAQTDQVFKNITAVLRAAGATWDDVIKMNAYMVGLNSTNVAAYREGRAAHLKSKQPPASTLVGVTALVNPELLLEVEVVAALAPKKKKR